MAEIHACDFEGEGTAPSSGDNLTTTNTAADTIQTAGTYTAKFTNSPVHEGSLSGEFVCTSGYANLRYASLAEGMVWVVGYLYYDGSPPSTNATIMEAWTTTPAIIGNVRLTTSGTLQLRDNVTAEWTSSALSTGWHRLAWLCDPAGDTHRLKVYSGANLDTATASQDSGSLGLTLQSGAASIDVLKVGVMTTSTVTVVWDDLHIDDAAEWAPVTDSALYDLTATYTTSSTTISGWTLDATGSTGTTSLTQTAGTSVGTITESPTGVFTFSNPAGTDSLVFDLDAGTTTEVVSIVRAGGQPAIYTKTASGWV